MLDLATGRRAHIEDPEDHLPDNRFNDGKCDPAGRLWAGTMAIDESHGAGALYCLHPDLTVHRMVPNVSVSNGLAWSLDQKTMYFVDSPTRRIVGFDYELESGSIDNARTIFDVPEGAGFPDGMTIDAEGHLWVALWNGGRVLRVDPAAGAISDEIVLPGVASDLVLLRRSGSGGFVHHEREQPACSPAPEGAAGRRSVPRAARREGAASIRLRGHRAAAGAPGGVTRVLSAGLKPCPTCSSFGVSRAEALPHMFVAATCRCVSRA